MIFQTNLKTIKNWFNAKTTPQKNDTSRAKAIPNLRLHEEIALDRAINWLAKYPDPDDVLKKVGLTRAHLRALEFDDEVAQCLESRREALVATAWRIEPQDEISLGLVEELKPHYEKFIKSAFNAVPYGYSVIEVVYKPMENQIGINYLAEKPLEWFEPRKDGGLIYWDKEGGRLECNPNKFFLTVNQGSYRQPYGEALLSRLYWPVFFRANGRKFWAKFLERYGEPLLIGKVADQQKFINDIAILGIGAALPVQIGDEIEAISANRGGEFDAFDSAMCKSIQKTILGQTLTSDVGSGGSYAAAKVHDSVRMDKRSADIRLVTNTVQRLINTLLALNSIKNTYTFIMADDTGLETARSERDANLLPVLQHSNLRLTSEYFTDSYGYAAEHIEALPNNSGTVTAQMSYQSPRVNTTLVAPTNQRFTADQVLVEELVDSTLAKKDWPISMDKIRQVINRAESPEELAGELDKLYQGNNPAVFRETLERALFTADILGYTTAQKRIGVNIP